MSNKFEALKAVADKYSVALKAHQETPKDFDLLVAWDTATSEINSLINNDEINIITALLVALEGKDQRISELEQGQQKPAGYIDARCFEGPYPTGGSWSLNPYNGAGLNQTTPFYLAPPKQTPIGYVDMFAVMRMHEGRMSFCALRPEPKGISYVSVYAGDSVAVPKEQKA
jgi:hypothetical protein